MSTGSDPLTPDDLAAMKEKHHANATTWDGVTICYECAQPVPCDAVRLLDEVERLRGLAYKRAGQMMARAGQRGLLDAIDNESGQGEAPSVSEGGKG